MADSYICYSIVNMYISGIHAGIQTAHAVAEMFNHREGSARTSEAKAIMDQWASTDKTICVLNGGCSKSMSEIEELALSQKTFPSNFFVERDADGLLTSIVVILPKVPRKMNSYQWDIIKRRLGIPQEEEGKLWMLFSVIGAKQLAR